MPRFHIAIRVIMLTGLGVGLGCRAPSADIPFGQWRGAGTMVYDRWTASADAPVETITRQYPTTMRISPTLRDGRDAIQIDIRSDRGPLPGLGDHTTLQIALLEAKRPTPDITLYRLAGWSFNPPAEQNAPPANAQDKRPLAASAVRIGNVVTVNIQYMDNFYDVIRFAGDEAHKSGAIGDKAAGLAHWSERLQRE